MDALFEKYNPRVRIGREKQREAVEQQIEMKNDALFTLEKGMANSFSILALRTQ